MFIQSLGLGNDMGAGWVMQSPCPCWVTGTPSWWPGTKSTSDTTSSGTRHNRSWPVLQSSSKVYYLCEDLTCIESLSYTRSSKILRKWLAAFNFHFLLFARKQSYMVASQPWPMRFCGPGVVRLGGMRGGERRWRVAEQGLWDGGCAVLATRPSLVTHSQWTQTLTLTWWHYRLELTLPQNPRNFSLVHGPISFLAVLELSICGSQEKEKSCGVRTAFKYSFQWPNFLPSNGDHIFNGWAFAETLNTQLGHEKMVKLPATEMLEKALLGTCTTTQPQGKLKAVGPLFRGSIS